MERTAILDPVTVRFKASFSFTKENISFNELNISSAQSHTGPVDTKFWQFVLFRTLLHWITGAQLLTVFLFDETNAIDFLADNVSLWTNLMRSWSGVAFTHNRSKIVGTFPAIFHNQGIRNVQLPPPEKVHVLGLVVALNVFL